MLLVVGGWGVWLGGVVGVVVWVGWRLVWFSFWLGFLFRKMNSALNVIKHVFVTSQGSQSIRFSICGPGVGVGEVGVVEGGGWVFVVVPIER